MSSDPPKDPLPHFQIVILVKIRLSPPPASLEGDGDQPVQDVVILRHILNYRRIPDYPRDPNHHRFFGQKHLHIIHILNDHLNLKIRILLLTVQCVINTQKPYMAPGAADFSGFNQKTY